jgi:PAS domain S-box-containing protein
VCNQQKTKAKLIRECEALRERVAELERTESSCKEGDVSAAKGPEIAFVLENMPVMIDAFDEHGNLVVWNHECERVTGYSADEIVGNPKAMELLYPDEAYRSTMMTQWKDRGNDYYNWEWEITAKDGKAKTVAWSNISDRFPVAGWTAWGIGVDVTESRQAFDRVLSEEQKYQTLVETLPDVVYSLDSEGRITFMSETVRDLFGFGPEEVIGRNFADWIAPGEVEKLQEMFQQIVSGRTVCGETVGVDKEDRLHDIEFRSGPLVHEGQLKGVLGVFRDISARKKAERALRASEEMMRGILNAVTESILLIDRDWAILAVNETAAKRFGRSVDELIGLKATDFIQQGLAPRAVMKSRMRQVAKVFASGKPASLVDERDGSVFKISFYPLFDAGGEAAHVAIFAADITEQRQAETALEESELRYRTLADNVDFAIGWIDKDHNVLAVNKAACAMLGKNEKGLVGKKCYREFEKRSAACSHCPGTKAMVTQRRAEAFSEGVRDDGTRFDVQIQAFPVFDDDGQASGFVEVVEDITEQEKIRKELDSFREEMVRADRLASLGTLSATFAHELTQPLTFVLLSVQGLLECPEVNECQTPLKVRLEETMKEISNAISVVDKFRSFARQSAKTATAEIHLDTVARKVSNFLSKEAEQVRVSIVNRGLEDLPAIYFSEQDLEQLFFALLQNAIQAADGKRDRTITVSGHKKAGSVEVQFADDCGGISKENLDRIFEPFFSTKTESQGTGLGLCVVEQIVSRAGGKVRVESALGEGTTFSVTLPIKQSHKTGV